MAGFGTAGVVTVSLPEAIRFTNLPVLVDAASRIVVGINEKTVNGWSLVVRRFLATGALDVSFGSGGVATVSTLDTDMVWGLSPGGHVLVAWTVATAQNTFSTEVRRLSAAGQLDGGYGAAGVVTIPGAPTADAAAGAIAVRADGGCFVVTRGRFSLGIVSLSAIGAPDPAYGVNGVAHVALTPEADQQASLTADGRLLIAATDNVNNLFTRAVVVRLTTHGSLDATFGDSGIVETTTNDPGGGLTTHHPYALVRPDGTLALTYAASGGVSGVMLTDADATAASRRAVNVGSPFPVRAPHVLADGRVAFVMSDPLGHGSVARFLDDGTYDAGSVVSLDPTQEVAPTSVTSLDGDLVALSFVVPPEGSTVLALRLDRITGGGELPGRFTPVVPQRLLDSRDGAPLAAGTVVAVPITGRAGTPASGVTSVAVNLTVTNPTAPGFISAYPCGGQVPLVSSVNFVAGQTVPNLAVVKVGDGGAICLYGNVTTDVIVDIDGWYGPRGAAVMNIVFPPRRVVDTREGTGSIQARLAPGEVRRFQLPDLTSPTLPPVVGALLNATVDNAGGPGYLTLFPCGSPPVASNLNFTPGAPVANAVSVAVDADLGLCATSNTTVDVIIDLAALWATRVDGPHLVTYPPVRIADSREGQGLQQLTARQPVTFTYTPPQGTIFGSNSSLVNITVVDPRAPGYLVAYPCSAAPPTSTLNFGAHQTRANTATVFSDGSQFCLMSTADTDIVIDLIGVYE